uniref:Photosystem II D1 protein, chloroplastic n=1 Tax=Tanacetum cinerariifolium TaxID=118510 RepID=A0A6L2KDY6_TANCI|nr:photosystem II D1 protein, chloroplastic [Tanacetum cinerariifolium]
MYRERDRSEMYKAVGDIDSIRAPVSRSLLYGNSIISGAIIPTFGAIACYMGREWELSFRLDIDSIRAPVSGSLLYGNNIISDAIIPTFAAIACYMGREWELSFRLGMSLWSGGSDSI